MCYMYFNKNALIIPSVLTLPAQCNVARQCQQRQAHDVTRQLEQLRAPALGSY